MLAHMPSGIEKRRFNVDEYYAMAHAGILSERDHVELIDGEVVTMTPIGPVHAVAVARANRALMRSAGERAIVWVQNPIRLDAFSEPQPDSCCSARPRMSTGLRTRARRTSCSSSRSPTARSATTAT